MSIHETAERRDLLASIRGFCKAEIDPIVAEHERNKTFPFELLPRLAEFGYIGGWLPEARGGLGIDRVTWALMMEELGYWWPSLRTMINITNGPIDRLVEAQPDVRDKYLPPLLAGEAKVFNAITEPDVGSNVAEIKTRADWDGTQWVINGQKLWISNGAWGEWGVVIARTFSPTCAGELSAFLVDKAVSPFDAGRVDTMVLQSSGTGELTFRDCKVPAGNLLGDEGAALKNTLVFLGVARINVAMGALGAARRAYDLSVEYAKTRHQFGRPIGSFQLVQAHIVEMRAKLDAARALCLNAAETLDRGDSGRLETSIAKYYTCSVAHEIADAAVAVHGAMGYSTEYPIERLFRDTRGASIPEGTTEVQTLVVGREILGLSAIK
ncbi:acyl-CoA dehydrogenase family protein [Cumulibacter manganitolerans]|uniref:acyl-CoA dehydrogenase family protein n=1 Tax=Cumulibacter manganitolerans TaxID=1884992 RepID=UPI00129637F8|nr:acyl-CoA dehydrogenase family protein [Cumulibacter manganitolerans]